jgi:hypothetical protein
MQKASIKMQFTDRFTDAAEIDTQDVIEIRPNIST